MTLPAEHISVTIECPPQDVYNYVANAENLAEWASGLTDAKLEKAGEDWIASSPMGRVKLRFAPRNSFGVADHDVTLPSGEVNHNPLRVVKNGDGSELLFTLYRQPGMSDPAYAKDRENILRDLHTVKKILEG